MARIDVTAAGPDVFEVTVSSGGSTTTHRVTADAATLERLGPGRAAEDIVKASFRFLLEREPKESILGSFDLPLISRYFPEYEARLGEYLGNDD